MSEQALEDEYFRKLDAEKRAGLREKLEQEHAAIEAEERRKLHYHMCGKCGASMETLVFRGIEIEKCISCSAVLLDPGELETLAGEDHTDILASFFSMFGSKNA